MLKSFSTPRVLIKLLYGLLNLFQSAAPQQKIQLVACKDQDAPGVVNLANVKFSWKLNLSLSPLHP